MHDPYIAVAIVVALQYLGSGCTGGDQMGGTGAHFPTHLRAQPLGDSPQKAFQVWFRLIIRDETTVQIVGQTDRKRERERERERSSVN